MKIEPVAFIWSGREMVPLDRFRALANRQFRAGQEYALVPHQGRSEKAHGLYFKCLEVAWQNLPEQWQRRRESNLERFPTSTHLRKWALVQEGFANRADRVCKDETDALEWAKFIREELDEYAVMVQSGNILTIWTAQSQDHHSMGRDEFQRSMDKVLSRLADMLGITVKELTEEAKKHMVRRSGEFAA